MIIHRRDCDSYDADYKEYETIDDGFQIIYVPIHLSYKEVNRIHSIFADELRNKILAMKNVEDFLPYMLSDKIGWA